MKKLIFLLSFMTLTASANTNYEFAEKMAKDLTDKDHALLEVALLNCRLERKSPSADTWTKVKSFADMHLNGGNGRKFHHSMHLSTRYGIMRYLRIDFEVNSWQHSLYNYETKNSVTVYRSGESEFRMSITDWYTIFPDTIRSTTAWAQTLSDFDTKIVNPDSNYEYRLKCNSR